MTLAECLAMAEAKTGALLGCACALGALLGGGTGQSGRGCASSASGWAWRSSSSTTCSASGATRRVTGKPVYSDLASRKKSLPVVAALTSATPAGHELADLYQREQPSPATRLSRAAELVERRAAAPGRPPTPTTLLTQAHAAWPPPTLTPPPPPNWTRWPGSSPTAATDRGGMFDSMFE